MKTSCQAVSLILAALGFSVFAQVSKPVKWSCIGNSITQGIAQPNSAYPPKLATRLGPSYTVENDGISGTTLLKSGDSPWTRARLGTVLAFQPDIVTIALGTNDSKIQNWKDSANFVRDYNALIDTLSSMPSKPQIWLCLPCPCWAPVTGQGGDIQGSIIQNSIIPRIKSVAAARNLNTIDFFTPMLNMQSHFPDKIHPDAVGGDSLASIMYLTYAAACVRIACIGNSITQYGPSYNTPDPNAYPSKLGMLLGRGYLVQNDGVSGCSMQKQAPASYWTDPAQKFSKIFPFKPAIVTIKLGTNDSRRSYWHTAGYISSYKDMVDTLNNNISPKPVIRPCFPIPATPAGFQRYAGINDTIIRDSVIPAIKKVAADKGLSTIDLYAAMLPYVNTLIPAADGVHPNADGQDSLAHFIYRNFTIASMQLSSSTIAFSAVTGQRDTAGTRKTDTVRSTAIAGTLAAVAVTHTSAWLSCSVDNTAPNAQKIDNALRLGSLPGAPGVYTDTVTVTAANANPASVKYAVVLTLQQGTGAVAGRADREIPAALRIDRSGGIAVRLAGSGRHTVTLTDARGKIISRKEITGNGAVFFPKQISPGISIIAIKEERHTVCKKVISRE